MAGKLQGTFIKRTGDLLKMSKGFQKICRPVNPNIKDNQPKTVTYTFC
jgi:hypothetical protein